MSLLDFLISPAAAQAAAQPQQGNPYTLLIMVAVFFGLMYFMLIRPQTKRQNEHRELLAKLAKGDEVLTSGGIAGRVDAIGDHFVSVEIADGVKVKLQKGAIGAVLPRGTLKSA